MSFNLETDKRIFRNASPNNCVQCKKTCTTIAFGLHAYVCSEACLRKEVNCKIRRLGLKDWAGVDLEPRSEED